MVCVGEDELFGLVLVFIMMVDDLLIQYDWADFVEIWLGADRVRYALFDLRVHGLRWVGFARWEVVYGD